MIEINPKILIVLIALSVVCVLAILGSLINCLSEQFGGCGDGDPDRWKWMTTTSVVLMVIMFILW